MRLLLLLSLLGLLFIPGDWAPWPDTELHPGVPQWSPRWVGDGPPPLGILPLPAGGGGDEASGPWPTK